MQWSFLFNSRDELDEFVFDFFLHKYGLYTLAMKHMLNLVRLETNDFGQIWMDSWRIFEQFSTELWSYFGVI